jgi:protocatechuate 3,4-dioxygenase alpha subunit
MRTPSQTVGPFFSLGLCDRPANELPGGSVRLRGRVLGGDGEPVDDALVEVWQPEVGFGRCGTDEEGRFEFVVPPAHHLNVMVFARGLLKQVITRVYFPGAEDDVLAAVDAGRRATLVAEPDGDALRWDVRLQGDRETVFFAV